MNPDKMKIIVAGPMTAHQRTFIKALESIHSTETVMHVLTGEETINLYRTFMPAIVFIDVVLSGMTGIEAARWIKEQDNKVKVILSSSDFNQEFVHTGVKNGLDGYIKKSSNPEVMEKIMEKVFSEPAYFVISET